MDRPPENKTKPEGPETLSEALVRLDAQIQLIESAIVELDGRDRRKEGELTRKLAELSKERARITGVKPTNWEAFN